MDSSIPCISCKDGIIKDMSGVSQLRMINRMIGDNYIIIFISFITVIILLIIAKYFGKNLLDTIKSYRNSFIKSQEGIEIGKKGKYTNTKGMDDGEIYDDKQDIDSSQYFETGKLDFVKKMQTAYKDYNKLKSDYIQSTYSKQNDDVINNDTLYKKYDDYSYKEKDI